MEKDTKKIMGIKALALGTIVAATMTLSACSLQGNRANQFSLKDSTSNEFNWCILQENGYDVLYEIKKWADYESADFAFYTEDGQYVWGSLQNANFYHDEPGLYAYDFTAEEAKKEGFIPTQKGYSADNGPEQN